MFYLVLGLAVFLGVHSVRIVADDWRSRQQARLGLATWQALYSLLAALGLGLIVWGFGLARQTPLYLWGPPHGMRHLAALFNLLAFVLLAAAYVPHNQIKAWVRHPMLAGVKLWALAHLLANGNLAHVLLFGSFLAWAVLDLVATRRRERACPAAVLAVTQTGATGIAVAIGVALWVAFTLWLHGLLIGVRPLG